MRPPKDDSSLRSTSSVSVDGDAATNNLAGTGGIARVAFDELALPDSGVGDSREGLEVADVGQCSFLKV